MQRLIVLIFLLAGFTSFGQGDSSRIQMKVYNPTKHQLTLVVRTRNKVEVMSASQFVILKPNDTTVFPFEFKLAEDEVPANKYEITIYEAVTYDYLSHHDYWKCQRIEGEYYTCKHELLDYIEVDTTVVFDSLQYKQEQYDKLPIYLSMALDKDVEYPTGIHSLVRGGRAIMMLLNPKKDIKVYTEIVVEIDGSVSSSEVLYTTDERFTDLVEGYYLKLLFIPGQINGQAVRSKIVFPIILEL
jgi:hypothetical protein